MALHSSVDSSMPSAQSHRSGPSSAEIMARFEAEQSSRSARPFFTLSLAGLGALVLLLSTLAFRSNTAFSSTTSEISLSTPAQWSSIAWNNSFEAAQQQAAAQGKPMMVAFITDWCGVCKNMEAATFPHPAVVAEAQNVVPVKINAESRTDLAQRFGIRTYPTFLWLDGAGNERHRVSAGFDAASFVNLMQRNR